LFRNLIFNKYINLFFSYFIRLFLTNLINRIFLIVNFSLFLFEITLLIFFIFKSVLRRFNSFLPSLSRHTNTSSLQLISRIISVISTLFTALLICFLCLICRYISFVSFFWFMRKYFVLIFIFNICLFLLLLRHSFLIIYLNLFFFTYAYKIAQNWIQFILNFLLLFFAILSAF
jgi:hypothetical protein